MQINVLLFATLKDIVGENKLSLSLPQQQATVADIQHQIITRFPQVEPNLKSALAAINEEFAFVNDVVNDGDEVAFFPPVSGGSLDHDFPEIFRLADETVDHNEIVAAITIPATGAVCIFSGMVRGETAKDGHIPQTEYLEYEAYKPMAIAKMKQVAQEIREQWDEVQGIAIVQRIGRLGVGENTVLIACSSAHRDSGCFEAARFGIDRLKEIVPVWKKEIGADGEAWIEGQYTPTKLDRRQNK